MVERIDGDEVYMTQPTHLAVRVICDALAPHVQQLGTELQRDTIRRIALAAGNARIAASRISKTINRLFAPIVPACVRQPWPSDYEFWIEAVRVEEPGVHGRKRFGLMKKDRRHQTDAGKIAEAKHIFEHERRKQTYRWLSPGKSDAARVLSKSRYECAVEYQEFMALICLEAAGAQ